MTAFGANTLFIYTQHGCSVCAEATIEAEKFKKAHLFKVLVVYVNASRNIVSIHEANPRSTPAYALTNSKHEPLKTHEGLLSEDQLAEFVFGNFGTPSKKRRGRE